MPIIEKIKNALRKKKKPKETYPDMPDNAEELARAMFWPNEQKRREAQKKRK